MNWSARYRAASNEQAQGIGQINTAVTEMDKVIQQNAANAEESASASEEMNAQAEQMKAFVDELVALVGGTSQRDEAGSAEKERSRASDRAKAIVAPETKQIARRAKEVRPEHIIPLGDDDFEDF